MSDTTLETSSYTRRPLFTMPQYLINTRLILFNGPAGSGKDTAVQAVCDYLQGKVVNGSAPYLLPVKYSALLKNAVHDFLGLPNEHDAFEAQKDKGLPQFNGATPRQCYIKFSEGFAKPCFGKDIWSERLWSDIAFNARSIYANFPTIPFYVVFSDLGFQDEMEYLKTKLPASRMALARLGRPGHTFAGDSRSYVFANAGGECWETHIDNNAGVAQFRSQVRAFVDGFLATDPDKTFDWEITESDHT